MMYPRHTSHAFQQRHHWTGRCVVPGCGLPTEHRVHQPDLPIEYTAPDPDAFTLELVDAEPEEVKPVYVPQYSLF